MLTYWETLIAARSNITVSDSYAKLWGRKLSNAYTVATYTGTLPTTLQTVAGYLGSYKIWGNTEQIGTPTPENPIVPSGCGELETTGVHAGQYKLPILSNSTVTNIYIGEVETTRRIKKLVLTGEEDWTRTRNGSYYINVEKGCPSDYLKSNIITVICSHYVGQKNTSSGSNEVNDGCICFFTGGGFELYIGERTISSATDFKSYLAAQYAAGTPVTVWYVLKEPETAVVNEPLMKIGDYADTIDSTQTNAQIPTSAGSTTISWAGEGLAPSEVELVYKVKR